LIGAASFVRAMENSPSFLICSFTNQGPRAQWLSAPDCGNPLTAPARAAAGVAFQAGAVSHHREVAALGAGFALVALHARGGGLGGLVALRGSLRALLRMREAGG